MLTQSETFITVGSKRAQSTGQPRPNRHREAWRKLVKGVFCPRCGSDAIYRYGKTANGKKRYLCQVCRRQFSLKRSGRLGELPHPPCPACGKPMHVYMHTGDAVRFRCADYPQCRTFVKSDRQAHGHHHTPTPLRPRQPDGSDRVVEPPADERGGS